VGTAFGVRAYPRDTAVQVVVTEGRVLVRAAREAADAPGTFLVRGERGVLDAAGRMAVERGVDVESATLWTKGRLRYERAPLGAVVADLGRWYDLEIAVTDTSLASERITITFDHALADDAVQRLANVLGVRAERTGRTVRLRR
jgi:transmembrane sensor